MKALRKILPWFVLSLANLYGIVVHAQVRLPRLVRDSMVLQRDTKINIWGWASAKEKVTIKFNNKNYKTVTDASGKWMIQLSPMKAGGPYKMDITGNNKIFINNILIGDVWICSGQSNMVHQMNIHDITYAKDIAEANYPQIRHFWIPTLSNLQGPQDDLPTGYWRAAIGEDVRPFSAVAYFFAKKIYEKYRVPIGLINASVGGTPIEAWTSEEGLKEFPVIPIPLKVPPAGLPPLKVIAPEVVQSVSGFPVSETLGLLDPALVCVIFPELTPKVVEFIRT